MPLGRSLRNNIQELHSTPRPTRETVAIALNAAAIDKSHHTGKGTRSRLNTAAEKAFFKTKLSK